MPNADASFTLRLSGGPMDGQVIPWTGPRLYEEMIFRDATHNAQEWVYRLDEGFSIGDAANGEAVYRFSGDSKINQMLEQLRSAARCRMSFPARPE